MTNRISRSELDQYLEAQYEYSFADSKAEALSVSDADIYYGKADLTEKQEADLSEILGELGSSFHERLFVLIDESGMSDAEVYRRAGIDRKLFSKIRSNPAYHPRKGTVQAICIALKLDIEDANDLLARAGYAFSPGSKGDLIVKFFIEHHVYDIDAVNYTLEEYGEAAIC